ncbi:SOS response-associated peptidase family protein [Deinococcus sp. JMULE3]|uniref:SOS response-associated peptidase family protein n=1 Tax=Deinococcus sp. JMULE3 TaxID=2518341 RepID=UPI0015755E96|nr:SOS response-associated peptidase family protein [Deinococcus sp. JMULE3]
MPILVEQFHPDAWAQLTRTFPCVSAQRRAPEVHPGEPLEFLLLDHLGWTSQVGRWGLRPAGPASALSALQAPVEILGAHRTFRDLLASGRCVIPLAAYWDAPTGTPDLPVRALVGPREPAPLYAAGVYQQEWTPRGLQFACAVVTRPAGPGLAGMFARMPALLREEDLTVWMTAAPRDARVLARDGQRRRGGPHRVERARHGCRHARFRRAVTVRGR